MKLIEFKYQILLFCFCFFLVSFDSFAQDVIVFRNGDEVQAKIVEISSTSLKYKKWDNLDGPLYSNDKTEVFMVKFQNGTKEVFDNPPTQTNNNPLNNTSEIVEIARSFMNKQITNESKGTCKLVDFKKENGMSQEFFGVKVYTLEYSLIIEAQKGFWKASGDKFLLSDWYWESFRTLENKGDSYAETFTNNYKFFNPGTKIEIFGKMDFEYTDNGWRISGISGATSGYENKRSRILLNESNQSLQKHENKTPPVGNVVDTIAIQEVYTGDLVDGKKNGFGKMVYENGNVYEGEWKDDKKSGKGKMFYKDGSSYEGEWKDDKMEGFGTVIWANGRKYVGYLVGNQKNGKGITHDEDGAKEYEGDYKNGEPDGFGIQTISDSKLYVKYEGGFKQGKYHGQGNEYILEKKNNVTHKFSGDFINGERARGTLVVSFQNEGHSATYEGDFKDYQIFNGTCTILYPDGSKKIAQYKNGLSGKVRKEKP